VTNVSGDNSPETFYIINRRELSITPVKYDVARRIRATVAVFIIIIIIIHPAQSVKLAITFHFLRFDDSPRYRAKASRPCFRAKRTERNFEKSNNEIIVRVV